MPTALPERVHSAVVAENAVSPAPGQVGSASEAPPPSVVPCSARRFELRLSLDPETQALLRHAQALLGHAIPSGDPALILKRALTRLVEAEEKRIFAAHSRTRPRRGAAQGRYVPADVRRAVWERDGRRCTFTSETGTRCPAVSRLEFDHVVPVARGGKSTAANLRLCCRAHNQYAAERTLGAGFMARKREEARARAASAPTNSESRIPPAPGQVPIEARRRELIPWLRQLGFRLDEARRGAAMCDAMADAPLEQRVRYALAGLGRARFERCTKSMGEKRSARQAQPATAPG